MNKSVKTILILIFVILTIIYLFVSINPTLSFVDKDKLMNYFYDDSIPYTVINKENYKNYIDDLKYPIVFKPSFCSAFGNDVKLIKNRNQAEKYMKNNNEEVIVQKYHPGPHEGTILYEKNPITKKVNIVFVERVNPKNEPIWFWKSSDSHNYGYYAIHRPDMETPALKSYIENIVSKIPELYLGRFDIRYSDPKKVKQGRDIGIIELNLQSCSDTRYNDKKSAGYNTYIFIRWILIRCYYGLCNVLIGNGASLNEFSKFFYKNKLVHNCYPKSKYINFLKKAKRSFIK